MFIGQRSMINMQTMGYCHPCLPWPWRRQAAANRQVLAIKNRDLLEGNESG